MKSSKLAAFGVAVFALASAGCATTTAGPMDMKMRATQEKMVGSCMSMSHDDMMKSADCTGMMKEMNMTGADMQTMMACRNMPHNDMMKDERCMSMMKMHSEMMKMDMHK